MIDTSSELWFTGSQSGGVGASVWSQGPDGQILIADCTNKNLTVSKQRLNARLCASAPQMFGLLLETFKQMEPEHSARFLEVLDYVLGSSGKEQ